MDAGYIIGNTLEDGKFWQINTLVTQAITGEAAAYYRILGFS